MVSLTGSVGTGKGIARAAADTLKRVHFELGGVAPVGRPGQRRPLRAGGIRVDPRRRCRVGGRPAARLRMCVVNDHLPFLSEMPHGGFKESGYGKDLSIYGLETTRASSTQ